jgi:hypothetical protein
MDGSMIADLKSVVAPLNFLVPMAEKPVACRLDASESSAIFRPYRLRRPDFAPGAPPRESIEVRTLVFFPPEE